jgi:alginate O-acetyltransferase complex protein AlgF
MRFQPIFSRFSPSSTPGFFPRLIQRNLVRVLALRVLALFSLLAGPLSPLQAQTQPGLYDPEPPANSAYVRIVHTSGDGAVDLLVDGKLRASAIARGIPCDYLVLPAGSHQLELKQGGKSRVTLPLDAPGSHALTLAFGSLAASSKPQIFEDKTIANKLKATLTVYHLHPAMEALDIMTADGKLTVFPALAQGGTAVRAVNPIAIELMAAKAGTGLGLARAQLNLVQGGSYSLILLEGSGGKLVAQTAQNKIERYTGK